MDKEKRDYILHMVGLIGLIVLTIFFGMLEVLFDKEIVNLEMVIAIIGTIVAPHAAQRVNQMLNEKRQGQTDVTTK